MLKCQNETLWFEECEQKERVKRILHEYQNGDVVKFKSSGCEVYGVVRGKNWHDAKSTL